MFESLAAYYGIHRQLFGTGGKKKAANATAARKRGKGGVERFKEADKSDSSNSTMFVAVVVVVLLALSVVSAYLSWSSNSLVGWSTGGKVFFAVFAFVFQISYIPSHILHKLDLLRHIKTQCPGGGGAPQAPQTQAQAMTMARPQTQAR